MDPVLDSEDVFCDAPARLTDRLPTADLGRLYATGVVGLSLAVAAGLGLKPATGYPNLGLGGNIFDDGTVKRRPIREVPSGARSKSSSPRPTQVRAKGLLSRTSCRHVLCRAAH